MALLPGISRSGSTIVGGLLRGLDRSQAARYSFLLGVPVILGAGLLSLVDIITDPTLTTSVAAYVGAFISAAVVGYLCIHFLLSWVRNHSLYIFAVYCAVLGGGYLLFSLLNG
jgi:undecaprenyl-diphosphatase